MLIFIFQVGAHYFEEGNVQLDASHECKDSTFFQVITKNIFLNLWLAKLTAVV